MAGAGEDSREIFIGLTSIIFGFIFSQTEDITEEPNPQFAQLPSKTIRRFVFSTDCKINEVFKGFATLRSINSIVFLELFFLNISIAFFASFVE